MYIYIYGISNLNNNKQFTSTMTSAKFFFCLNNIFDAPITYPRTLGSVKISMYDRQEYG